MRQAFAVLIIFLFTAAVAAADIVAVYSYQDGTSVTLAVKDSNHIRMDTSQDSYMLIQGEKVYSVSKDDNGKWMVMDMDQMSKMSSGGIAGLFSGGKSDPQNYRATYVKTAKKETIAGYTGVVYHVEVFENDQVISSEEVVLSSHSDLKQVNDAWISISEKMTSMMGQNVSKAIEKASAEARSEGYGGMLRYGNEMRLKSVKKSTLDASYFELPSGAQKIQMGGQPSYGEADGASAKKTDYPDPDQESVEEDETDSETSIEEVTEGVQKLFKGLFD